MVSDIKEIIIVIPIAIILGLLLDIMLRMSFKSIKKKETKEEKPQQKESKTYVELLIQTEDPYQKINNLIDSFIDEASRNYLILNGYEREDYMNKEFVDKYEQYVLSFIQKNMSDSVKETIGLCYNIKNNDKELERILKLRTKLFLINIVAGNNVPIQD